MSRCDSKVMCVGDDWQSIYRFAGSDLHLFTHPNEYFGKTEILRIEKTYRNAQQLLDYASSFVTRNPNQLKKNLKSEKSIHDPIKIIGYSNDKEHALNVAIKEIFEEWGENAEVMLLGRNNFDISFLNEAVGYRLEIDPMNERIKVTSKQHPHMNIYF